MPLTPWPCTGSFADGVSLAPCAQPLPSLGGGALSPRLRGGGRWISYPPPLSVCMCCAPASVIGLIRTPAAPRQLLRGGLRCCFHGSRGSRFEREMKVGGKECCFFCTCNVLLLRLGQAIFFIVVELKEKEIPSYPGKTRSKDSA